ncbi:MAG TPA: OmpA family protein [Bryobacteraceae bacterium]|nr:OmpA family protein [Bryobacteraceae bacterium]
MISKGILLVASSLLAAQVPNPTQQGAPAEPAAANQNAPLYRYRITVVSRAIPAVNYSRHSGSTPIDFRGTGLMPEAKGEARVDSRPGATRIDAKMEKLTPATQFGPEYLTYVLWAITPEGRAENLGEVVLDGDKGRLETTTPLQAFGLVVTAEPYFAVTQPSDVVVMENVVRKDTTGTIQAVNAKYELLQRGVYVSDRQRFTPVAINPEGPLQLAQAENAVKIARLAGADRYAAETLARAETDLQNARQYWSRGKSNSRVVQTTARAATQAAEDARVIAYRRIQEERQAAERAAAEQAQQVAARRTAEAQRAQADRAAAEQARADAERLAERAQADRAAAETEAERARAAADQARRERDEMRRRLIQQLGTILETRETARGVIVSIGDVLFDFDRATLKQDARERLAKVAGVLLAYPGLNLRLEGHTDSVGTQAYNMKLSHERAEAVRSYFIEQGVRGGNITAAGLGPDQPVASNDTAEGRQQNRRVELVVTGDVIGIPNAGDASRPAPQP